MTFITAYVNAIFGIDAAYSPVIWVVFYAIFLGLNIFGLELSFKVTLVITLLSLAVLVFFWISALPVMDFSRWALNIGIGPDGAAVELPEGNGPWFPFGISGVFATLPFAVWLFLAIEQLPLAAEESVDPKRDMPRGIIIGMLTLIVSAFMIVFLNPSVPGVGSFHLGSSLEPLLDGFRAIYGQGGAVVLGIVALTGLIASFHTILYAKGRQIYSLSRAGYFPTFLSLTHSRHRTPHVSMVAGALVGLAVMLVIWFSLGAEAGGSIIGSVLPQHGGLRGDAELHHAGGELHPAPPPAAAHRPPLPLAPRRSRGGGDDRHRRGHAPLPGPGSELLQGRALGLRLVRGGDALFHLRRAPPPHPLARGGIRHVAPRRLTRAGGGALVPGPSPCHPGQPRPSPRAGRAPPLHRPFE